MTTWSPPKGVIETTNKQIKQEIYFFIHDFDLHSGEENPGGIGPQWSIFVQL